QEVSSLQLEDLTRDLAEFTVIAGEPTGPANFPRLLMVVAMIAGLIGLVLTIGPGGAAAARYPLHAVVLALRGVFLLAVAAALLSRVVFGDFLEQGERCPVALRADRFAPLEHGTIRLDEHRPRGAVALSSRPHVITWARARDRDAGRELVVL